MRCSQTQPRARLAKKGGPRRLHPRSGERSYRRQTVAIFAHAAPRSGERSYRRQTVAVFAHAAPRSGERIYRRQSVAIFTHAVPRSGERIYRRQTVAIFAHAVPRSGERSYRRQTVAVFAHAVPRSEKEICKNVPQLSSTQNNFRLSSKMVTGPSLISCSCMSARKTPVATVKPCSRS